jgi:hypothetical protein
MTRFLVEEGEPKLLLRLFFQHHIKVTHTDFETDFSVKLNGALLDEETIVALNSIGVDKLPPLDKIDFSILDSAYDTNLHHWMDLENEM